MGWSSRPLNQEDSSDAVLMLLVGAYIPSVTTEIPLRQDCDAIEYSKSYNKRTIQISIVNGCQFVACLFLLDFCYSRPSICQTHQTSSLFHLLSIALIIVSFRKLFISAIFRQCRTLAGSYLIAGSWWIIFEISSVWPSSWNFSAIFPREYTSVFDEAISVFISSGEIYPFVPG